MSMLEIKDKVYNDGRTKQSFKDSTDINKILKRAQKTGTISHLAKWGGEYADYSDFDYMTAQLHIAKMGEIFDELPSEVRAEFGHNPGAFFEFANDPKNVDRLTEVLPQIAEPGNYFPNVDNSPASGQARAPEAPVEPQPDPEPQTPPETPEAP